MRDPEEEKCFFFSNVSILMNFHDLSLVRWCITH